MMKLILSMLLVLAPLCARAACTPAGGALNLCYPNFGDAGNVWAAAIRNNFVILNSSWVIQNSTAVFNALQVNNWIHAGSSVAAASFYGDGTTLTGVATSAQLTSTAAALTSEIARATAREDAIAVSTGVLQADLDTEVSRAILRENAIAVSTGALEASKVNRAGDTMTGNLVLANTDGSLLLKSGTSKTGLYWQNPNNSNRMVTNFAISAANVPTFDFYSADGNIQSHLAGTGDSYINGYTGDPVGIGTTDPTWNLEVAAAAGSRIAATDNGGASKKVLALDSPTTANPYAQIFAYDYGGSVGLPLSVPYGNFGVGISGPAEKVEIYDGGLKMSGSAIANPFSVVTEGRGYYKHTYATAANGGSQVYSLTDGDQYAYGLTALIGVTDPTDTTPAIILQSGKSNGATSWAPLAAAETVFQIKNYTSELVTVLGGGSMGLGTISPDTSYKLDINGNSIMARATAANSSGYSIIFDESSGKFLEVLKRGSSATGNLGLPAGSAEILNYNNGAFGIYNANAGVDGYIALGTGGTEVSNERFRITYDGKVGVGDPAPTAKLVVNGNIVSSGTVQADAGYFDSATSTTTFTGWVDIGRAQVYATGTSPITASCAAGYTLTGCSCGDFATVGHIINCGPDSGAPNSSCKGVGFAGDNIEVWAYCARVK